MPTPPPAEFETDDSAEWFQSMSVVQDTAETIKRGFCVYSQGYSGKLKLLEYDIAKLVKAGAFRSMLAYGTIFTMDASLYKALLSQFVLSLLAGSAVIVDDLLSEKKLRREDLEVLVEFSFYLNNFVPFLLSFWVSLAISRWWSLRTDALGEILSATANMSMVTAAMFPDTEQYRDVRNQVLRYGITSVLLMIQAARDKPDLEQMTTKGLLTKEETALIEPHELYQRSMVMWPWALKLIFHGFEENNLPLGVFNFVMLEANTARNGIQTIHTYLETQVPLAYVHLISLTVTLTSIVVSVKSGQLIFMSAMNLMKGNGESADVWLIVTETVYWLMVQVIYFGLLAITYFMHDPFGDDILDFPVQAYSDYVLDSCRALLTARNCPAERRLFADSERVKAVWKSWNLNHSKHHSQEPQSKSMDDSLRAASQPQKTEPRVSWKSQRVLEPGAGETQEEMLEKEFKHNCKELMKVIKRVEHKLPFLDEFEAMQKALEQKKARAPIHARDPQTPSIDGNDKWQRQ